MIYMELTVLDFLRFDFPLILLVCGLIVLMMTTFSARDELLTEFDRILWFTVVDTVTVNKDGSLTFRFYDGTEIIR